MYTDLLIMECHINLELLMLSFFLFFFQTSLMRQRKEKRNWLHKFEFLLVFLKFSTRNQKIA